MTMPGFTAETALPRTSEWYRLRGPADASRDSRAILPQARFVDIRCFRQCRMFGGLPQYCFDMCSATVVE
jgi:hypothetical protein